MVCGGGPFGMLIQLGGRRHERRKRTHSEYDGGMACPTQILIGSPA